MSRSQSKIPSPGRSAGAVTPRRARARRTRSTASARSDGSVRLSAVVERYCKEDFVLSPLRRSVLPDDTGIEAPRRASWWKRLEESSRDVLEALDTNKMTDDLLVEEYEFEVEKDKQNQSAPESSLCSDNESVASIVVPQRRLFNQKKQPQFKFADIDSRKSLGRTSIEDQSIEVAPKTLFNKGPRNKPVFPAALLNSTNKTINKTVEPEPIKQTRPNLFGQAGTKRKNLFADFVVSDRSDSEEDSEVQHKVYGFKKNNNKRISLGTRTRRMPSLTPSVTTEIDIDDWNLLPSSTMIGTQEVSGISTDDLQQVQEEIQDVTLTEGNDSLNRDTNNRSNKKSAIENDENDKTLTNEDLQDASHQEIKMNESIKTNKSHEPRKSKLNESVKNKTLQNKSSTRANAESEIIEKVVLEEKQNNAGTKNLITEIIEPSIEDVMAELHGESVEKEKSRQNVQLDRTKENVENYKDKTVNYTEGKEKHEIEPSSGEQKLQDASKAANDANQNEDDELPEIDNGEQELEQIIEEQKSHNRPKDASIVNQDKDLHDRLKRDKTGEDIGSSVEDQVSEEQSKEANETNQEEDIENENEKEIQPSTEEQETSDHSEEASDANQDEDMNGTSEMDKSEEEDEPSNNGEENDHESNEVIHENEDEEMEDMSAKDESEEEVEPSDNADENQHETTEVSHENEDEEMDDKIEKDKSEKVEHHQGRQNDSEEESVDNHDEEMEKMVWNDNDDEKASDSSKAGMGVESKQNNEVVPNKKGNESGKNRTLDRKDITNKSKNLTNKSHKIVESSVDNDQMDEEVVDETPNNSTHDTTGRNRKNGTCIKSPEAVLQNMTNDNESFRPIGRSTTFRKSKSLYEMMNRPSLAPVQESTLGSEGSRNSSTEGSEWDSHRTTRKTIRQTLGKEYTTRKSLRALVMEQSAKRQTEIYNKNMSNINKTKNKTVSEGNDKNSSKINKSKTVLEDANRTATIVKTKNNSLSDKNASTTDVNNKNVAINKTKNKTVLDDVNDQKIRRRTSSRNLSSNQSPILSASIHETSTHHVPDPLIPESRISHHKSLHEINDPEISNPNSHREDSIYIPDNNDSGPEISLNASYGQGMSADTAHEGAVEEHNATDVEMNESPKQMKKVPRNTSIRSRSIRESEQEILDYEASELEKSAKEESDQENVEQDDSVQSVQDNEKEDSELEESVKEVEAETDHEESEQENEDSQQEIEAESQQDIAESENEGSQQEIAESENEESQQGIESEQDESQQEIESEHETQEEIESQEEIEPESDQESEGEQENDVSQPQSDPESGQENSQEEIESQQEIEPESDQESEDEQENAVCQPQSDPESGQGKGEPERDSEDDDFVSGLNSRYHDNRSGVSRVVFDSRMMSVDEINFEGVSRQTENEDTEQSVREPQFSRKTRISEPSAHEVSVGTKKSLLLMQMQKIAQQNMERKQKIRDKVQKSLKPTRGCNIMSPVPKYSIRRITKEPKRPTKKPTRTGIAMENLPKAFLEDLNYKPPKRFHKANAPWITNRLYKFLETKLEPKYDYRARVRAEELVQTIYSFCSLLRRRDAAPPDAVDRLKAEMARLRVVNTHFEFYDFFHEFMPTEVRHKVNPDVFNKIPLPRNGIFGEILQSRNGVE